MKHAEKHEEDRRLRHRGDVGRHEAQGALVHVREPGMEGRDGSPGEESDDQQGETDLEGERVARVGPGQPGEVQAPRRPEEARP